MEDIDREEFYYQLKNCKSLEGISKLIDNIDNDNLQVVIKDKYKQFLEYNKENQVNISNLIVVLETTYLDFIKSDN